MQSLTAVNSLTNTFQQDELHVKGSHITPVGALGSPLVGHPRCGYSLCGWGKLWGSIISRVCLQRLPSRGEWARAAGEQGTLMPFQLLQRMPAAAVCWADPLRISEQAWRHWPRSSTLPAAEAAECLLNPSGSRCNRQLPVASETGWQTTQEA